TRLAFLSQEAGTRNPRRTTHLVIFISTGHCDTRQFLIQRSLTSTSIKMGRFSFHCSQSILANAQRPNQSLEPTAGRREVHVGFYERVLDVCHARRHQRWLSSISLDREAPHNHRSSNRKIDLSIR